MEIPNKNHSKKAIVPFLLVSMLFFAVVKKDNICADVNFVFDNKEQPKTYLQVSIHNNTAKDIYLYYPIFKILRENNMKIDTLSITSLWGNKYLDKISPFIFERQDSLILRLRETVRNNVEYKKTNWNNPVWLSESDDFMIKHSTIIHFIKKGKTISLKYYFGNIQEKGKYQIIYSSRKNDEMYKYLPTNFEGYSLYKDNIYLKNFSFIVE